MTPTSPAIQESKLPSACPMAPKGWSSLSMVLTRGTWKSSTHPAASELVKEGRDRGVICGVVEKISSKRRGGGSEYEDRWGCGGHIGENDIGVEEGWREVQFERSSKGGVYLGWSFQSCWLCAFLGALDL